MQNQPRVTRRAMLRGAVGVTLAATAPRLRADDRNDDGPLDVLISGGKVADGAGGKIAAGDVGVREGRIAALGDLSQRKAKLVIDARGKVVCPGFIDIHTHSDRTLLKDGLAESAVRQGATTHVVGNCGSSPAPADETQSQGEHSFTTFGEFLQALRDEKTSINVCPLVGHNRVRATALGYENRAPSQKELAHMRDLVREAMRAGAAGMSTGLVSPPGTYAQTDEIVALAKVVAEEGGLYASHIRGEASTLVDAVAEAIQIGHRSGAPVEISHHKAAGKENWGKTRVTLLAIEEANRKGQRVRADVYPYRAGSAGLSQLVPPWAHEGGREKMLARLRDTKTRPRIIRDMERGAEGWANFFTIDWRDIQITRVATEKNRRWVGRRVADVAEARGCSGTEACVALLVEEDGDVGMINFIMNEYEMRRVLAHPLTMIGSDGTAVSPRWHTDQPHPRYYGCYPRVLGRYVREAQLLSLETAIYKMTGMPAEQLGLKDRGLLQPNLAADVVIFDPETILDRATFDSPHQFPAGISTVLVNGEVVVADDAHTGARPGKVVGPSRS